MNTPNLLSHITDIFTEMKVLSPVLLDLEAYRTYCDYMVVATGTSNRHLAATSDRLREEIKRTTGQLPLSIEGGRDAQWLLMDYGDVVIHLLTEEARTFYDLEGMWGNPKALSGSPERAEGRVEGTIGGKS